MCEVWAVHVLVFVRVRRIRVRSAFALAARFSASASSAIFRAWSSRSLARSASRLRIVATSRCRAASPPLPRTESLAAPIADEDDDEEEGACARRSVCGGVGAGEGENGGGGCGGSSAKLACVAARGAATPPGAFKPSRLIVRSSSAGLFSRDEDNEM